MASFGVSLTDLSWTKILGWSLYGLTVLPIVLGVLLRLAWITRGVPLITVSLSVDVILTVLKYSSTFQHMHQSFNPTDEWYRNEHAHIVKTSDRQSSTA